MRLYLSLLLAVLPVVFFACDEDDPQPPALSPSISAVQAPEFLFCEVDTVYTFSVRVDNLTDVDSVYCSISRPDGSEETPFRLYDDANALSLTGPAYASEHSGDAVANNGTYTRGVRSALLCNGEAGVYEFQFHAAAGGTHLNTSVVSVEIRQPQACAIVATLFPNQFDECFAPVTLSVGVSEDSNVPIDTVVALFQSGDTVLWHKHLSRSAEPNWTLALDPSVFGCTPTGTNYTLRFEAYDRFGLSCTAEQTEISFVNGLPEVLSSSLPDTMYRPVAEGDSNIYEMFIDFSDCEVEGWTIYHAAFFDVRRQDAPTWDHISDFFLRDDGVPPDAVAGDGTASSFLKVMNNGRVDDLYYFNYYMIDCASGDTSNYLMDSTRIIQAASPTFSHGAGNHLGFSAPK